MKHNGPKFEMFVHITIRWLGPRFAGQDLWHEVGPGGIVVGGKN
jgi:hypothetical protein